MNHEEIHKYLNDYSPDGMEFNYIDHRYYCCCEYSGRTAWSYIPEDITIEELDEAIKGCIEYFDVEMVPPVDGVNVV